LIDHEYLKSALHYDPDSGIFTWRHRPDLSPRWNTRFAGKKAGCVNKARRHVHVIRINDELHLAHRLAWLYMTGEWPACQIDHRNCDSLDNRWPNLREATGSQNQSNTRLQKNSTTGFKGVTFMKSHKKYVAQISVNYKHVHLGYFDTTEEAHTAHCAAAKQHRGEYARVA